MTGHPIFIFATFFPAADRKLELQSLLETMVEHTRKEPGNEVYNLFTSGDGSGAFHLFERYRDDDSLEAHRASEYYIAYRAKLSELLASPVQVTMLREFDVLS